MRKLFLVLPLMLPVAATAQAVMTWLMPDLPPASIRLDGQPSTGIVDMEIAYVAAHWPEVEHRYIYANLKRSWTMLDAGEPACYSFTLINAERLKRAYIVETIALPPLQLFVRAEAAAMLPFNADHQVDLAQLLAMRTLRGLLSEKRSYGVQLDAILRKRPPDASLKLTTIGSYGENIFSKMRLSRADYTIDYDFVYAYYQSRNPKLSGLQSVPIAGSGELLKSGFACPKTPWGKATAQRIDAILGTREGAQAMRRSLDNWLSPNTRQLYANQFAAFYRQRERPMRRFDDQQQARESKP